MKKDATGKTPIEKEIVSILNHSSVSFHLLPLAKGAGIKSTTQPKNNPPETHRKRFRSPSGPKAKAQSKGKGGGKGKGNKSKRGRGPNVPEQLIGKTLQTKDNKRVCWEFSRLPNGCNKAAPGGAWDRGLHVFSKKNEQMRKE